MIESWIDIPNLQTVHLPGSFKYVKSKSINSIDMNVIEWIDVSTILADLIPFTLSNIELFDSNITSIQIPNYSISDENYTIFNFSRFILLEELIIGNDCFSDGNIFKIDGLNHLKSIKIGMNSFTKNKDSFGNDSSRSFSILNCIELESIEIGRYSFSDYGGLFELFNLPKLSTIKIGEIGSYSYNFFWSSFEIKGIIDMILLMNRSSTFEFDWIRWSCILWFLINSDIKYLNDLNEWIIDLPHLNSIKLGWQALYGMPYDSSCSLLMESDIEWMNDF